ncbi:CLUMA_CG016033, isoform A [Clunio marinus]|uniref:CLUMA_CG016033, isoform A n=1 Tax=Clunio marinus TaxID=568069 RepID=A0A1J1IR77_9DIPT|nr:CLUMA_CG016033, isoform A [Clunio marinus]
MMKLARTRSNVNFRHNEQKSTRRALNAHLKFTLCTCSYKIFSLHSWQKEIEKHGKTIWMQKVLAVIRVISR